MLFAYKYNSIMTSMVCANGCRKWRTRLEVQLNHDINGLFKWLQKMADENTTAQVHPEKLTHALLNAAQQHGAKLKMGTVEGVSVADGKVTGGC